jgi:hypothetical protein
MPLTLQATLLACFLAGVLVGVWLRKNDWL